MKKTIQFLSVIICVLMLSSFIPQKAPTLLPAGNSVVAEEGYYVFLTIDGVWSKEKRAYLSKIIYYPGYKACEKEGYRFIREAEKAFAAYLKAEYSEAFPYNVNNIISYTGQANSSASANDLKTLQQAQESLNSWMAKQKEEGNTIVRANFSFACEKD
ncbi:MAG TPA: hypothetical protein VIL78_09860 [Hanamia sp.]